MTISKNENMTDLLKDLGNESKRLISQEFELARKEMREKGAKFARNSVSLGVGVALAYLSSVTLIATVGFGIYAALVNNGASTLTALWVAPLVLTVVLAIVGFSCIAKGIHTLRKNSLIPERTLRSLKQTTNIIQSAAAH